MQTALELIIFALAAGSFAYFRVKPWQWTIGLGIVLLGFSVFSHLPWWFLGLSWLLYAAAAVLFNITPLRQLLLSDRAYVWFKQLLPPMSQTEQEALDAGDVWWDGEVFQGRPDWRRLLDMPTPELNPEEQNFLDNQVEALCAMIDDWQMVNAGDMPDRVWQFLKDEGFFGLCIDKNYGGLGFSAIAHSTIVMKIATRSMSAAVNMMVPNSLGPAELLTHYGTDAQKSHYLPRLARGVEVPCFALTAPEAGSDATAIPDSGVVCRGHHDGKELIGIRLNWDKRYITLAPRATVLGLAFKLYDPDHLLGETTEHGITVCLVPTSHPGVEIGLRHAPMGMAFLNGPTRGTDVFIPLDWIIGGPSMIGQGWRMLMECLSIGRGISLPALSTAVGKVSYMTGGAYALVRKQFKTPIGHFEGVEEALGRIGGYTYLLDACRRMTAGAVDQGVKPSLASAIAKYHMTEISRKVIDDCMDVHAGRGIQLGPRNYLGYTYMAIPVSITVEGANILTRNLMIFGQGAMRCHPYVRAEIAAAYNESVEQGMADFDKLLTSHIGYAISNCVRSVFFSLGGWRLLRSPVKGPTAKYYRQLTRMSTVLAFVSDMAMLLLGGDLKRKERLSARLGDVLSHLYMGSMVLKHYQDQGANDDDLPYVHWALQHCFAEMQIALDGFFANFPRKLLGRVLKRVVFPIVRPFKQPASDKIVHQIARSMMQPSALRDRLGQDCFIGEDDDAIGRLEDAFKRVVDSVPLEKKVLQAIKDGVIKAHADKNEQLMQALNQEILNAEEVQHLQDTYGAVADAIAVDDFSETTTRNKQACQTETVKSI
ncbi:MAG: acyl-CoA dehydrogenase [Legionellales bacterium]|nr:acyl-CoA dehydrogenase [Legionellales bacterium]|tara:strand:+ start:133 stop:2598 length:2466 start_codon:yes stop_codon:yes gene_type:complete